MKEIYINKYLYIKIQNVTDVTDVTDKIGIHYKNQK